MRRVRFEDMTVRMLAWTYLISVEGFRTSKRRGYDHIPAPEKDFSNMLVLQNGHTIRFDAACGYLHLSHWVLRLIDERRNRLSPLTDGRWRVERNGVVGEHTRLAGAVFLQAIREALPGAIDHPIPDELAS